MFGIGGNELLIIAVFVLIIFGPDKLPQLARTFGEAVKLFKKAQSDMEHMIRTEVYAADDKPASVADNAAAITPKASEGVDAASIWSATDQNEDEEAEEEE